jgi:hypothetical protein
MEIYGPVNSDAFRKEQKQRSKLVLQAWGQYKDETKLERAFQKLDSNIKHATVGPVGSDAVRRIDQLWTEQAKQQAPRDLWERLLGLYSERMPWRMEAFLVDMRTYGITVTSDTYAFVLHAYMKIGETALVRLTLSEMRSNRIAPSSSSCLEIMQYLTKTEGASAALAFFDDLRDTNTLRTLPVYHVALGIAAEAGDVVAVVTRFHQMAEEKIVLVPDRTAWRILIALHSRGPNVPHDVPGHLDALLVFLQMEQIGVSTAFTEAALEESVEWLDDATEAALTCLAHLQERKVPMSGANVCLIGVLATRGDFPAALRVLTSLRAKGQHIGFKEEQLLINGFIALHKGKPQLADVVAFLDKLRGVSVTPRQHSFHALMELFLDDDKALTDLFDRMLDVHKVRPDIRICNVMLAFYKRAKKQIELAAFIRRMRKIWVVDLDATSYGILVQDYFEAGSVDECLELVSALEKTKDAVDDNLIKKVIELCGREGRMEEGQELFAKLDTFGIMPTLSLWGAVIDGWVQHGSIEQAVQQLVMMRDPRRDGMQPSPFIGASLCGEVMRASGAFELATMPKPGKVAWTRSHVARMSLGSGEVGWGFESTSSTSYTRFYFTDYDGLTVPQLKKVLVERGLSTTGIKAKLLARLDAEWRSAATECVGATGLRAYEMFGSLGGVIGTTTSSGNGDESSSSDSNSGEAVEGNEKDKQSSSSDSDSSRDSNTSRSDDDLNTDADVEEPPLIFEGCSATATMTPADVIALDQLLAAWLAEDRRVEDRDDQFQPAEPGSLFTV